jgi:predicted methyltransferase
MTTTHTRSRIDSIAVAAMLWCGLSLQPSIAANDSIEYAIASERFPTDRIQDDWRKPAEVLSFLEVAPGQHALDFFAGPGYYSELLSRVVGPSGSVLIYNDALYTQAAHHDLMVRLTRNRLPNAKLINQPANYLKLKPESLDRVLFVQVYHDIYWHPRDAAEPLGDAQKVLGNLRAALKPNGLVVVVEHVANDTPRSEVTDIANRLHRIDPNIVREDFALAGFEFVAESTALRHPDDDHTRSVFSPTVRHRTDQFIYKFRKP